jgi:ribosomal protein S18 acetylase RimI-like enzyme
LTNINTKLALKYWFSDPSHQKQVTASAEQSSHHFQIRAATSADLRGVAQIIAESFHSQNGLWGWAFPLLRLGIYEDLKHRLLSSSPHHICLVAVNTHANATHQLVGTVEMGVRFSDPWTQVGRSFLYLSNLAVHPEYRRHGVASQLLVSCEQVSREWGFDHLYLHVLENNYQARQLYFKLGYKVHTVESNLNIFFSRQSRQILLHKHLHLDAII